MIDDHTPDGAEGYDQLLSEATTWFARMRGPDAEEHRADFNAWLGRGAAHRGALNRAGEIWAEGKFLEEPDEKVKLAILLRAQQRWSYVAVAAAVALILVLGVWIANAETRPDRPNQAIALAKATNGDVGASTTLATAKSRGKRFRLEDGSWVILDPDSRLTVAFTATTRALCLTRGRGQFDVAHEARPFVVYAGGGSVTAHGTVFEVAIDAYYRTKVKLVRGSIDVAMPAVTKQEVRRLAPGQEVAFDARPPASPNPNVNIGISNARRAESGLREFDDVSLAALVEEANRHGGKPVFLVSPETGETRVSGRFSLNNTEQFADQVAQLFDLTVDKSDPSRILLRRRR